MRKYFTYDLKHSVINQMWRLISGPLILIFIPLYISADMQGYWFLFISMAALSTFADLGFSTILLQFSAHEFAYLHFNEKGLLEGDDKHLLRISTLFRFSLKWILFISLLVFPVIFLCGYYLMSSKDAGLSWLMPWLIYAFFSGFVFLNSIILSFIEGCNLVGDIQKIRLYISMATTITMLGLLLSHAGLFALAFSLVVSSIMGMILIYLKFGNALLDLLKRSKSQSHTWKKEIFSLLWRYAISWSSGYFIFQIFTPIAFTYYGAIEAGQVGMTIAICMAIFSMANVWMTIVIPKINMLVAKKDYKTLNKLFRTQLLLSIGTYLIGLVVLFIGVILMKDYVPFFSRLVDPISLLMISLSWLFQIIISGYGSYMRAFKKEPLVMVSILSAIYVVSTTFLIGVNLSFDFYFIGFLTSYIWSFPWVYYIYKNFKKNEAYNAT